MHITFRDYLPRDADACVAVLASNVPDYAASHELELFRGFLGQLPQRPSCRYLVGEALDAPGVAIACGGLAIDRPRGVATFCWGLVAREHHRRGIGNRMALERLAWVVDDDAVTRVELDTSQRTRGFFARFGFADTAVTPDAYAPGLDRHDMVLELDAPARARLRAMLAAQAEAAG